MTNKFLIKIIQFCVLTLLPAVCWSQSYQLGTATYAGNACPQGSVSISVSPDGGSISFIFDKFSAGIGQPQSVGKRGVCSIRIPMTVSPGFILQATSLDYRGFISLPNRATSMRLSTSGNLSTVRLPPLVNQNTNFVGPVTDNFTVTHKVMQSLPNARKCNTVHEMRLDITAEITSRAMLNTELSLDSADVGIDGGGLTMGVVLQPCNAQLR